LTHLTHDLLTHDCWLWCSGEYPAALLAYTEREHCITQTEMYCSLWSAYNIL